jgi:signal transduction histidine kinase
MEITKKIFLIFIFNFFVWVITVYAQEDTIKVRELIKSAQDKNKPFKEVISISENAITLADKINYPQGKADAINIKGKAYLKLGEYPDAMNAFWEELALREKLPGWKNSSIGRVYVLIGESYRAIGNYDLAVEYVNKGLALFQEEKDIAYAYNRLAAIYFEISYTKLDTVADYKAEEYASKSLEISKNKKNTELTISTYNIIGGILTAREKYDDALKYFFYAIDEADKDSTYTDKPNILYNISNVYYIKHNYEKAIQYGIQSYELSNKYGIKIYILMSARVLAYAYADYGDFKKAYLYQVEASNFYINIFDEKKSSIIYGLQKKHEEELREQEKKSQRSTDFIIGIALISVLLILGVGFSARHRNLIIHNKELAEKNKLISEQKEELSRTNITKDKFFSILSHDIRNPLNGILGFSNLLNEEFNKINDKEKKEYINYLKTSSESLFKLIDKLLLWSRLQSDRIEIKKKEIKLKDIISNSIDLQKANAIRKDIILENYILDDKYVVADKDILEIVFRNLIDNAVKFTSAGGVVTMKSETTGRSIIVSIADTGVGMNPEDLNKIFQIDKRISSKGTDSEKGTGLGLILCKEMLELIGTTLKVESEIGKGSRFFFELPLA